MSRRHVVTFLTAPARSGKTFNEVRKICDEYLGNPDCRIYTNLPLHLDKISEWAARKYGIAEESVFERVHIVPRETELAWMTAGQPIYDADTGRRVGNNPITGPWDYFADKELSGAVIIIDEIHNFCGSIGTIKAISNLWQKWLGELGHNQAVFRCLSQAPEKVHACIKQEAQASYSIRNTGLDRDPYFKIEIYDWLELWAGLFGGSYTVYVFEQETTKVEGKKIKGERALHAMGKPYFDFYDSFNKPIAHGQTTNVKSFEPEYVKRLRKGFIRGRLSLLRWFFFKNFYNLVTKLSFVLVIAVGGLYLLNGGMGDVMQAFQDTMKDVIRVRDNPAQAATDTAKPAVHQAPAHDRKAESNAITMIRKAYEDELRKALNTNESLKNDIAAAQKNLGDISTIVLFTPDTIVTMRGNEYAVGEEIDYGEHAGKRIVEINYRQRKAILDDGAILLISDERLRRRQEQASGTDAGKRPDVQAVLPGS